VESVLSRRQLADDGANHGRHQRQLPQLGHDAARLHNVQLHYDHQQHHTLHQRRLGEQLALRRACAAVGSGSPQFYTGRVQLRGTPMAAGQASPCPAMMQAP
jgi:hypothetical protein